MIQIADASEAPRRGSRARPGRPMLRWVVIGLMVSTSQGCGIPSDDFVRREFERGQPGCVVVEVFSTEGDASTVYKRIRYRRRGSLVVYETEWGYQEAKPTWRRFHPAGPVGNLCAENEVGR